VTLLDEMLKKSEEEQEKDHKAYATFKCYCDTQTEEKEKTIEESTKAIELLSADISELQGSNGVLSTEAAKLKREMADNEHAVEVAQELRDEEEKEYLALKADLDANIPLLGSAIETLGAIGADQTLETSQAHTQFMGGFNESTPEALVGLESTVRTALVAAKGLLKPGSEKLQRLSALLQAPLGTTYETQSGEIVGILREMKETFEENLADATAAEKAADKAHTEFLTTKADEYKKLEKAYDDGQETMGSNDDTLATKKSQLDEEILSKKDAEDFLAKLEPMCSDKAKDFEARKSFRASEQAAISEAIALLNSDAAYKTFSKTTATGGAAAALIQLRQLRTSERSASSAVRAKVEKLLAQAALTTKSNKLRKVLASLSSGNPFTEVLEQIEKIEKLIEEEGKLDAEQKGFCEKERKENEENLQGKKDDIETLETEISELDETINHPTTGLKVTIATKEEELDENTKAMKEATDQRRTDNLDYQAAVANTSEARELLAKAIALIESYYATAYQEATGLLQTHKEDPAPPDTWEDGKIGTEAKGNEAVDMLKNLLSSTETEEAGLHETEQKAQSDYEDDMTTLKDTEKDLQDTLAVLQEDLADAEKTLVNKNAELEQTKKDKAAIEAYLLEIKPGCDFIMENFVTREDFRAKETTALQEAVTLLTASPAYIAAEEAAKHKSWGDCKEVCLEEGEKHAKCLACNAKVSVPGYCAGHEGVTGC